MSSIQRKKLLIVLYATIVLISTAFGAGMTLIPVYAEGLGAGILELGYTGALAAGGYTVMTILSGLLLDRYEKIRLYLAFNLFTTGALTFLFFTRSLDGVLFARALIGFTGGAFWTSAGTVTADLAPKDHLAFAIGRYNLSWIIGFVIGPFFGGFISDVFGYNTLWLFLIGITMVANALIGFLLVPGIRLKSSANEIRFDFPAVKQLKYAYLAMIPYALGLGLYFAIIPGYLAESGVSASVIGVLIAASGAIKGVGFFYSEKIIALGPWKGLLTGAILLSMSLLWIGYSATGWAYLFPLLLYGASNGIIEPIILDYLARNSPKDSLGTTMGVYEGIYGASTCISPLAAGLIGTYSSPVTIYIILSMVSLFIIPVARKLRI
jgi:DHA1 family tetracycline resistance protein-like MFS transporter